MKFKLLFFLMIALIVSSCSREHRNVTGQALSHFRCSNLYDGVFISVENQGDLQIAFSPDSNQMAVETLTGLKERIAVACGAKKEGRNLICLVGYFTDGKTETVTTHNAPESEKPFFCLLGWYIQAPFFEHIEAPEGKTVPSPKLRDHLHASDFEQLIDPELIHHDKKRGLFWIGAEPPEILPRL